MVPENIHTSTIEGIGNSRGVGGSKAREIPEGWEGGEGGGGGGDGQINFQMVQFDSGPA